MSQRHDEGWIDDVMPVQSSRGAFAAIAGGINGLVASHIAVEFRIVEVVTAYADGKLDQPMDRLPARRRRSPRPSIACRLA